MSFPKAKIQRFNDIKDCTPSPAKYNVLSKDKVKLGIILQSGKYAKKSGSPPNSESDSVHSTPCFQTPTVPLKRKKILGMSFKNTKSDSKLTDQEELREKIVECNNKDLYIKDLTEQIEEMAGKFNSLKEDYTHLQDEKDEYAGRLAVLQNKTKEDSLKRAKEYKNIKNNLRDVNNELRKIRQKYEDLRCQNLVDMSKTLEYIDKFQKLYEATVTASREELEEKEEKMRKQYEEQIEFLKIQFEEKFREKIEIERREHLEEAEALKCLYEGKIQALQRKEQEIMQKHSKEVKEKEELEKQLKEGEAKINLLEENLKDVSLLTEMQMKQKIEETEATWKQKLEDKEKESEAILKECQAISEYSIIQSEVEKNQIKKLLEEKEEFCKELITKNKELEEEIGNLKTEKHAYDLSIVTFQDTIEVLKKRLFDSDRDVEQLKEELERSEERNLNYERKCMELANQLNETEVANEELEMQYESTSKLMQNEVKTIEKDLVEKVEKLKEQCKRLKIDKKLLKEVVQQSCEQQELITKARETIAQSALAIETMGKMEVELQTELKIYKSKLIEESEEAAEIRKKYIEKSGKYDELAQQFEQILQELDKAKGRIQELEHLIGPYQEQLEAYQNELRVLNLEKETIASEAKEIGMKYAEVIGHQNHQQKIKHLKDLKMKSSELFQKNIDLEAKNYKLSKTVDKLMKEIEEMKKSGKKMKVGVEDKENLGSPKCLKGMQSPGPLKDKN